MPVRTIVSDNVIDRDSGQARQSLSPALGRLSVVCVQGRWLQNNSQREA